MTIDLILGDCLEVMKSIPDKSVDAVITDPPYGKSCDKGTNGFGSSGVRVYSGDWDKSIPSDEYFSEIFRVSKNQIIFGGNYFQLPVSNCWIVWDKKGDINFQNPFADCELIWTNYTQTIKKYTFRQQGFIRDSKDKVVHPTQKPSELLVKILNDFTHEGDVVLDPFMGSGTTGVACVQTGRNFIGIEIDPGYFKIAQKRIHDAQMQMRLDL